MKLRAFLTGLQHAAVRTASDQAILFHQGDAASHGYALISGAVEILQCDASGAALVSKILVAPNLLGILETLGHEPFYLESVRALGPVRVRPFSAHELTLVLSQSHEATLECLLNTVTAFSLAARFSVSHLATSQQKLANYVHALFELFGETQGEGMRLQLKRSQVEFAQAIGMSERNVSRLLAKWDQARILRKSRGRYELLDRAKLHAMAGELAGSLIFRG